MVSEEAWFALQTKPRAEQRVRQLLAFKGYECFVPSYFVKRRWSDRMIDVEFPLFPMYVFCSYGPSAVGKAITTPGIVRILGSGGVPSPIDRGEIEALQKLVRTDVVRAPSKYLPIGTVVRIETGPLKGICGILCTLKNQQSLVLSVTLLQRSLTVELQPDIEVSVVESPSAKGGHQSPAAALALGILKS